MTDSNDPELPPRRNPVLTPVKVLLHWLIKAFLLLILGIRTVLRPKAVRYGLVALVLRAARATGARHFASDTRYSLTDDHIPLLDAGLPTADIIDFDYPAWHTHADTPDQVSPESLAEVARVASWLVYESPLARGR